MEQRHAMLPPSIYATTTNRGGGRRSVSANGSTGDAQSTQNRSSSGRRHDGTGGKNVSGGKRKGHQRHYHRYRPYLITVAVLLPVLLFLLLVLLLRHRRKGEGESSTGLNEQEEEVQSGTSSSSQPNTNKEVVCTTAPAASDDSAFSTQLTSSGALSFFTDHKKSESRRSISPKVFHGGGAVLHFLSDLLLDVPLYDSRFLFPGPSLPTDDLSASSSQFYSPLFFPLSLSAHNEPDGGEKWRPKLEQWKKIEEGLLHGSTVRDVLDELQSTSFSFLPSASLPSRWRPLSEHKGRIDPVNLVVEQEEDVEEYVEEPFSKSTTEEWQRLLDCEEDSSSRESSVTPILESLPARRLLSFISWRSSIQEDLLATFHPHHDRVHIFTIIRLYTLSASETKKNSDDSSSASKRQFKLSHTWSSPSIRRFSNGSTPFIVSAIAADVLGEGQLDIVLQGSGGELYVIPNCQALPSSSVCSPPVVSDRGSASVKEEGGVYQIIVAPFDVEALADQESSIGVKRGLSFKFKDPLQPMLTAAFIATGITLSSKRAANLLYVNDHGELLLLVYHGVAVNKHERRGDNEDAFYYNATSLVSGVVSGHREVLPYSVVQADVNGDCAPELVYAVRDLDKKRLELYAITAPSLAEGREEDRSIDEKQRAEKAAQHQESFTGSGYARPSEHSMWTVQWISAQEGKQSAPSAYSSPPAVRHRLLLSLDESMVLYGHPTIADVDGDGFVDLVMPYCKISSGNATHPFSACLDIEGVRVWYNVALGPSNSNKEVGEGLKEKGGRVRGPAGACLAHPHHVPTVRQRSRTNLASTGPNTRAQHEVVKQEVLKEEEFGFRDTLSAVFPINVITCGLSDVERSPVSESSHRQASRQASSSDSSNDVLSRLMAPQLLRIGDYNRDGKMDFLLSSNVGPILLSGSERVINFVSSKYSTGNVREEFSPFSTSFGLPFSCSPLDIDKASLLLKLTQTEVNRRSKPHPVLLWYQEATAFFIGGSQPGELQIGLSVLQPSKFSSNLQANSAKVNAKWAHGDSMRWFSLYEQADYTHENYYMLLSAVTPSSGDSLAGSLAVRGDIRRASSSSPSYYGSPAFGVVHHLFWHDKHMRPMEVFATQLSRSNGFAFSPLQVLVGLGQTFSYAHRYMVGRLVFSVDSLLEARQREEGSIVRQIDGFPVSTTLPLLEVFTREWPNFLVPNAQVFSLLTSFHHGAPSDWRDGEKRRGKEEDDTYQSDHPEDWGLALHMPVQKYRRRLLTTLVLSLIIIGIPVIYLRYVELREDELEWRNR